MRIKSFDVDDPSAGVELDRRPVKDEHQLESWLHQNPSLLLSEPILVIGRQFSVNTGTPDLVGIDKFANVVVFELKSGKSGSNSATEQSILGQPQSYARALAALEYGDLKEAYRDYYEAVEEGVWDGVRLQSPHEDLEAAFKDYFERAVATEHFNTHQRMVIVAEEITRTTAENTRHLVREGLPMQCVEVQCYEHSITESDPILAAETVVDYSLQQVTPDHERAEQFEHLLVDLREQICPQLEGNSSPMPLDYVTKNPRAHLAFMNKTLFEDLNLSFTVKPYSEGYATLSFKLEFHGEGTGEAVKGKIKSVIRGQTDIPDDDAVQFDPASSTVVQKRLPLGTDEGDVTEDSIAELVSEFVDLVVRIHPVVVETATEANNPARWLTE